MFSYCFIYLFSKYTNYTQVNNIVNKFIVTSIECRKLNSRKAMNCLLLSVLKKKMSFNLYHSNLTCLESRRKYHFIPCVSLVVTQEFIIIVNLVIPGYR